MFKVNGSLIFAIIIILLIIFLPGYSKLQKLKATNKSLTEQIEKLTIKNEQLAQEAERLNKDIVYVEKVAREKMGISKKDEVIYKIEEQENDQ